jgi:hypothetical protein
MVIIMAFMGCTSAGMKAQVGAGRHWNRGADLQPALRLRAINQYVDRNGAGPDRIMENELSGKK